MKRDPGGKSTERRGCRIVPILMYHQVSPVAPPGFEKYVVSPRTFSAQMAWLWAAGYSTISLDTLVGAAELPAAPVILTFDDGFRDCLRYAPEVLRRYGFRATFFVVAGLVGQTSRWMTADRNIDLPLASWTCIRRIVADGFDCGAHSLTHPKLALLSDAACRGELEAPRDLLEAALQRPVVHLAYPYGSFDTRVRRLAAEAGYTTACTVEIGISTTQDDLLTLRRVPVSGFDSLADFAWRLRRGHSLRDEYARWRHGRDGARLHQRGQA